MLLQILIIGWAITPYLNLDRSDEHTEEVVRTNTDPHSMHNQHTSHQHTSHLHTRTVKLVDLLLERAQAGVMIRVMVWNETNWGFMLDSHKIKHILEGLQYGSRPQMLVFLY
jgi:hypothetical protein